MAQVPHSFSYTYMSLYSSSTSPFWVQVASDLIVILYNLILQLTSKEMDVLLIWSQMGKNQWEVAPLMLSVSKDSKIAFFFDRVLRGLKVYHQNAFCKSYSFRKFQTGYVHTSQKIVISFLITFLGPSVNRSPLKVRLPPGSFGALLLVFVRIS